LWPWSCGYDACVTLAQTRNAKWVRTAGGTRFYIWGESPVNKGAKLSVYGIYVL